MLTKCAAPERVHTLLFEHSDKACPDHRVKLVYLPTPEFKVIIEFLPWLPLGLVRTNSNIFNTCTGQSCCMDSVTMVGGYSLAYFMR